MTKDRKKVYIGLSVGVGIIIILFLLLLSSWGKEKIVISEPEENAIVQDNQDSEVTKPVNKPNDSSKLEKEEEEKGGVQSEESPSAVQQKTEQPKSDTTSQTSQGSQGNGSSEGSQQGGQNNQGSQQSNTQPSVPASSPAKTEHTHSWVAITEQKWVIDKAAYDEKVIVKDAWDEEVSVPVEKGYSVWVCNCGAEFLSDDSSFDNHLFEHLDNDEPSNYRVDTRYETTYEMHTVHHDAEYKTVHHKEEGHYETVTVGYKCSCGERK